MVVGKSQLPGTYFAKLQKITTGQETPKTTCDFISQSYKKLEDSTQMALWERAAFWEETCRHWMPSSEDSLEPGCILPRFRSHM